MRGAAAVAALAGILVLAGSIAAGASARAREAATLKVLGAARWQILTAYVVEYGAVGVIAGLAGVALGAAAAWPVVVKVFEAKWSVDWSGIARLDRRGRGPDRRRRPDRGAASPFPASRAGAAQRVRFGEWRPAPLGITVSISVCCG